MQQEITPVVPTLEELLAASAATPSFRTAVLDFAQTKTPGAAIRFAPSNPPVKVLRAIMGLLEHAPALAIESVVVDGQSGCSDYRGTLTVNGAQKFQFVWDCAWKAEQMGWKDFMGYPDQVRAARTFGYRCFQTFVPVT
jgi:hypothetical protein